MSNLVIVAIPEASDPVWEISSEKVPHLTILFLGDNADHPNLAKMVGFTAHAIQMSMTRFGLEVDRRGELGPDKADVVFFEDSWNLPKLREFRENLLKENNIRAAYDSVEQYPVWTPHLTLGYPDSPAKKGNVYYVQFDRIAIWDSDYSGLELVLDRYSYSSSHVEPALAMGSTEQTKEAGAEFLAHYGVKGMRWGVRRYEKASAKAERRSEKREPAPVQAVSDIGRSNVSKTKIRTVGGENHPASKEAVDAAIARRKLRKSGVNALSNQELQELQTRLNLEKNVLNLEKSRPKTRGQKFVDDVLEDPNKTIENVNRGLETLRKYRK